MQIERAKYRTFKTTTGRKIRVRMSEAEIRERRIFLAAVIITPFAMCWLMAGWLTPRALAAEVKLPSSTTARKVRILLSSNIRC